MRDTKRNDRNDEDFFDRCITDTILSLPARIRNALSNVAFVIERKPPKDSRRAKNEILGMYHGIPLIHRSTGYQWVLPDTITIYQDSIKRLGRNDSRRLIRIIRETVLHEIAHHLGFSEKDVRRWEKRSRGKKSL
jgi:predicted Zn-dependent protease with MMP-like domain